MVKFGTLMAEGGPTNLSAASEVLGQQQLGLASPDIVTAAAKAQGMLHALEFTIQQDEFQ